jgi:hypothetical protein
MASLAHIALGCAMALSWFGLGTLLLAKLRDPTDTVLDALNRFGAGAVAWALLTAGAGWLGVLYRWVYLLGFIPCVAIGAIAAIPVARAMPRPHPRAWARWEQALGLLIAMYLLLTVISTLAPISSADALVYHAAAPALFEKYHRLIELPWNIQSYQPLSLEMLVLDGFLLWNPIQGALAPMLLGLAAIAVVAAAAFSLRGRTTAILAAAIFAAQPFMLWVNSSTFVEPGLALMIGLSAWNLWRLRETSLARFAILAGVFAGGAAGMKYDGLAAGAVLGAAGLILVRQHVRPATVAAFAVPAALIALPWYVKNAIVTGNPVYPLIFGGANPEADAALRASLRRYGRGHSILDAFLVPFRFLTSGSSFDRGDFMSPLYIAFAPLALLKRSSRRTVIVLFALALSYAVVWFVNSQQARFLVPLLPGFAIVTAIGVLVLAATGRAARVIVSLFVAGALASGLAISIVYTSQFVPYLLGHQSESAFLEQKTSSYDGIAWLNAHVPKGVVLTDIQGTLYLRAPYIAYTADVLPPSAGPVAVRQFVRCWNIEYVATMRGDTQLRAQMHPVLGRLIGETLTHLVLSRTRNTPGPSQTMLVFRVHRAPGRGSCGPAS